MYIFFRKMKKKCIFYYLAGYPAGYRISIKNICRISGQISILCNPNQNIEHCYIHLFLFDRLEFVEIKKNVDELRSMSNWAADFRCLYVYFSCPALLYCIWGRYRQRNKRTNFFWFISLGAERTEILDKTYQHNRKHRGI